MLREKLIVNSLVDIMPNKSLDIYGMLMPTGSYAQYFFDNENLAYGFITSGTMTVSENGQDAVSVECTFVTVLIFGCA